MAPKNIKVTPGKTQSKFGFVVGIVFVCIGLFIAIPTFGLFGLFWTAVAVMICLTHYKNGFTDQRIPSYEIQIDEQATTIQIEERLRKLEDLYNQRLITTEEYQDKRKEILNEI